MDAESKQRWLQGNRQYSPWQYSAHAMAQKDGQLQVMPIHLKEQLHEYLADYTAAPQVFFKEAPRRMLANSWHVWVAAFIIALVLQSARAGPVASPEVPCGLAPSAIATALLLGCDTMAHSGPGHWKQTWSFSAGYAHHGKALGNVCHNITSSHDGAAAGTGTSSHSGCDDATSTFVEQSEDGSGL